MSSAVKFFCPRWGFETISWDVFLKQVKKANYAGIEWFPFAEKTDYNEVLGLLEYYDLDFAIVMAVTKPYHTFEQYLQSLRHDLRRLLAIRDEYKIPIFVSAQTGREFFDYPQIKQCLAICDQLELEFKTPIYQETHRNKWSFAAHTVAPVLDKHTNLKLTLDVSHWFCVSESYLEDQQPAVNKAIAHTKHIHARVGHTQGPQVWDPALPEYAEALEAHLQIWDQWVARMRKTNTSITITPEFGPTPYLTKGNRTSSLRDEQWRVNLWMKDFLADRYAQ